MTQWKVINNLIKEFTTDDIVSTVRNFSDDVTFFTAVRVGDCKEKESCGNCCHLKDTDQCIHTDIEMDLRDHCQLWKGFKP